ncbi:MAG: hypothetical protein GC131_07055 [Alphaproteobacteria bacterium]|nr:hypothetical protein [Alphaproteobacteria bacterium]
MDKSPSDSTASTQQSAAASLKVEDDRSIAMSGAALTFEGVLLTAENGALKIPQESRNLCALFDSGMWLVSATHRNSPLVTSVAQSARRQGYKVDEPRYVTPNIIQQAYSYSNRQVSLTRLDENAVRRRVVETLQKAVELGTNDVHIEASGGRTKVEFRIDGSLRQWETWTQREGEHVLSAVYSHSIGQSGATANWLEPQAAMLTPGGGADTIQLPEGVISVRCQWVPLADGGRYLDMRLQYDSAHLFGENFVMADVDSLGFSQEQLRVIQQLRAVPGGMRVFSGPVNQGKTTTLRVMLNRRMAETNFQLNCLMIEDPPEGGVIGARQIGVSASVKDDQRERTFAEIMRCALRLDPDIVMLGETRDLQTAKFSFRLALTGRQVYTTLHVYSALAVPQRLRDLGLEPYLVYDHQLVRGMICQRLLRGMCEHCRIPLLKSPQELGLDYYDVVKRVRAGFSMMDAYRNPAGQDRPITERLKEPDISNVFVANPEGCKHCYKGRSGRTVCAEVIETDAKLMELLSENKMAEAEHYWLSPHGQNGITMLWHALEKIRRGEVSPVDAEFEVGPVARERDILDVEQVLGVLPGSAPGTDVPA